MYPLFCINYVLTKDFTQLVYIQNLFNMLSTFQIINLGCTLHSKQNFKQQLNDFMSHLVETQMLTNSAIRIPEKALK